MTLGQHGTVLVLSLLLSSCWVGGERDLGRFREVADGMHIDATLPYRHAGWNLWLRGSTFGAEPLPVSIWITNLGDKTLYVKSGNIKEHIAPHARLKVFSGTLQEAVENVDVFVATDTQDIHFGMVLIPKDDGRLADLRLIGYTSDGP